MSRIIVIIKKEFARFFTDPRMIFGFLIMPVMVILLMATVSWKITLGLLAAEKGALVFAVSPPPAALAAAEDAGFVLAPVPPEHREAVMEDIACGDALLLAVFTPDFEESVKRFVFNQNSAGNAAESQRPYVELYYNSSRAESLAAHSRFSALLDSYEDSLANAFDVKTGPGYNLTNSRDFTGFLLAAIVPFLVVIYMLIAALALTVDAIAGEKERGTITALLVTSIGRGELAAGKVLGVTFLSLLSALCLYAGALPLLVSMLSATLSESQRPAFNPAVYGFKHYALSLPVLFSSTLLMVTAFSLSSAFAKTTKEANVLTLPVDLIIIFCAFVPVLNGGSPGLWYHYFIPFYNSVLCIRDILTFDVDGLRILQSALANCALSGVGILLLAKMFDSERIMFQ